MLYKTIKISSFLKPRLKNFFNLYMEHSIQEIDLLLLLKLHQNLNL